MIAAAMMKATSVEGPGLFPGRADDTGANPTASVSFPLFNLPRLCRYTFNFWLSGAVHSFELTLIVFLSLLYSPFPT
jgi:hypothetical protein